MYDLLLAHAAFKMKIVPYSCDGDPLDDLEGTTKSPKLKKSIDLVAVAVC